MENDANDERGKQILTAIYKACMESLFAIGVKSPQYIDLFAQALEKNLDKQFQAIGLTKTPETPKEKSINDTIETLDLPVDIIAQLHKSSIFTIAELFAKIQQDPITSIKDITQDMGKIILERIAVWNKR